VNTLNVDDWAAGVGINPHDPDQVFTFSRDRAIYAWSIKTGRYVDGPYQQPLVGDFFYSKLKSNPNLDYLVNIFSMNAISLWPIGVKTVFKEGDRETIEEYSQTSSRVYQDQSGALKILPQDQRVADEAFEFSGEELARWYQWREEEYRTKLHPKGSLTRDWYLNFLVTQNTKDSLEQALVLRPSDPAILQQYASKLESLSMVNAEGASKFKERAAWYRDQLETVDSQEN